MKGKEKKRGPASQEHPSTVREKRKKFWIEQMLKKQPFPKTPQPQQQSAARRAAPPADPRRFSANWKELQQILKTSPPAIPQPQNGVPKKRKENVESRAGPSRAETGRKVKHKAGPDTVVNSRVLPPSGAQQPVAPKRKRENGKTEDRQAAKKKKPAVEERKPTEEDLWFDDVDPDDVEETMGPEAAEIMRRKQGIRKSKDTESPLVKENAFEGLTRAVAIDCEMVGVGPDGVDSILARVSLVNHFGKCIYDKYVKPTEKVTDYRTSVSGIRPTDIKNGENIQTVQREVAKILQGRIVVGHAIHNDLKILLLDHPKKKIRDTQKYKPFKKIAKSGRPSLKALCKEVLNVKVQQGEHSSVQDAQAAMRLYTRVKKRLGSRD
ncbi:RNA exonuclease 4 [Xenentodon cancila]